MIGVLVLCINAWLPQESHIDAGQFARLMHALHQPIHDVTFVYEGEISFPNPAGLKNHDPDDLGQSYQGHYSFRADGSAFLDHYGKKSRADDRLVHSLYVNARDRYQSITAIPDVKATFSDLKRGGPGVLNHPGSPERINYLWFFQGLKNPASSGYQFLGWEDVDGHRCLLVQFDQVPITKKMEAERKPIVRYWIDMERGGHPLKVEVATGPHVRLRCQDIQLQEFDIGREKVWLPVSGKAMSYYWEGEYHQEPVVLETYRIVRGTVVFNAALKDSYFDIYSQARRYPPLLQALKDRFGARATTLDEVQKNLDEKLAEADRQSRQIEASFPDGTAFFWYHWIGYAFLAMGFSLVGGSIVWRWRKR